MLIVGMAILFLENKIKFYLKHNNLYPGKKLKDLIKNFYIIKKN